MGTVPNSYVIGDRKGANHSRVEQPARILNETWR